MNIKFVFSSVPVGTKVGHGHAIGPMDHDHHYQSVYENLTHETEFRDEIIEGCYTALGDGDHDQSQLHITIQVRNEDCSKIKYIISDGFITNHSEVQNHIAAQSAVEYAVRKISNLLK